MRKLIILTFITLDGIMQAPGGPEEDTSGGFEYGGWVVPYFDEFSNEIMEDQMNRPFDLLLGRKTYDLFASYWPHHKDEGRSLNEAVKYVTSHEDIELSWEKSILLKGDIAEEVQKIKNMDGPDIQVHGSGELIQTLFKNNLIDEMWLKIFPITLGTGKRLFGEGTIPKAFRLKESKISPKGVIFANYEFAGEVQTGTF